MANYTFAQLEKLWTDAGGSAQWASTMAAVALAESKGDPNAKNSSGATGLWQTVMGAQGQAFQSQYAKEGADLTNPLNAAKVAVAQLGNGSGISNWTADAVGKYVTQNGGQPLSTEQAQQMSGTPTTVAPPAPPPAPGATTTTPASATIPAGSPSSGSGALGGIFGTGALSTTKSSGYYNDIKLPSATTLVQSGVDLSVAEKIAGKTIRVATSSNEIITGPYLLKAIDSLEPKSVAGVTLNSAELANLNIGLHTFFSIPNSGNESFVQQAAAFAASYIPTNGDLQYVNPANLQAVNLDSQAAKAANAQVVQLTAQLGNGLIAANTGATKAAQYSAQASVESDLTNWGIDTPAMNQIIAKMASSGVTNVNEILQQVRETPTYKAAFPALAEYNAQPGVVHMTESEYRTYSQSVLGAAQQYGIPSSFMNQGEIGKLLLGHVSPLEFQQRAQDIYSTVMNTNQNVRDTLAAQGITPSHLMQYWADPTRALPQMQRQVAGAEISDYAHRVGLNQGLTSGGVHQLADMARLSATQGNNPLGVGVNNIESSLQNAARDSALLKTNPGQANTHLNTNALIGSQVAGFQGTNQVADQIAVGRAESARAAPFDKGGGPVQTTRGVLGAGSSAT